MKLIHTLLFSAALVTGIDSFSQQSISSEQVNVVIHGGTSRQDLATLRTDLDQVGIQFWYNPQFDGQRNLLGLEYRLTDAATESVLGEATVSDLPNPTNKTAFILSRNNGTWTAQCVGNCPQ